MDGKDEARRGTIVVTWRALLLGLILFALWLWLIPVLQASAGVEAQCLGGSYHRTARLTELVTCSFEAGTRGWLFLGFLASFPAITLIWLRALFSEMLARGRS